MSAFAKVPRWNPSLTTGKGCSLGSEAKGVTDDCGGEMGATVSVKIHGLSTLYMVPKIRITVHDAWLAVFDRGERL